jgi:hypothetical protein
LSVYIIILFVQKSSATEQRPFIIVGRVCAGQSPNRAMCCRRDAERLYLSSGPSLLVLSPDGLKYPLGDDNFSEHPPGVPGLCLHLPRRVHLHERNSPNLSLSQWTEN